MREVIIIKPTVADKKQKRVAAYARVSTNSEKLKHSLSSQVSYYSEYIQNHKDWIYCGVYADEGITGTSTVKREQFNRLIRDCDDGNIDIVLVKSISRFARNTVDLLNTVRHLKELGIEVIFEKENISSFSRDGEFILSILASFAQEESRSISDNVKWGTHKRFEKGIPNGRVRVFGYDWVGDTLKVVPHEAEIVKRMFQDFINGKTRYQIQKDFEQEGITTRLGNPWVDSNIKGVLTNVTYTGNMLLQKVFVSDPLTKKMKQNKGELPQYFVENTHEPIIDLKTFEYVQEEMKQRCENRKKIFSSKIQCAYCNGYYIRNTVGKKTKYHIWTCGTKRRGGCSNKDIREDVLLELVTPNVDKIIIDREKLQFIQNDVVKECSRNGR